MHAPVSPHRAAPTPASAPDHIDARARLALADLDSPAADTWLAALTQRFAASAAELDRDARFPHANLAYLRRAGLLALSVPRELGGRGASLAQALKVVRAVARGEPSTALILVMQTLYHHRLQANPNWPQHLKERLAHEAVEHGALINSLRVEPELGSPARGGLPATVGSRHPDGWRLNGRKIYSTGSPGLSWFAVWARSDETPPRVGTFLVHREMPGIRVGEPWNHLGMRATGSHEVIFEDVLLPPEHALDLQDPQAAGSGMDPSTTLWMNVLLPAVYDAVARAGRDWFAHWASTRAPANLGAPLSTLASFQQTLGRIDAGLLANRVLLDAGARGALAPSEVPALKYLVTRQAIEAVELALEASGNPGLSRDQALERHYRDVLCARIHTPQNDVALGQLGRAGFAAFAASAAF
jgi:alkylation response protein AidB-like acyl-CoA dehydrogenase